MSDNEEYESDEYEHEANAVTNTVVDGSEPKRERLNGRSNYLGWSKLMKLELQEKGYLDKEGKFVDSNSTKALSHMMRSVSLNIAGVVEDSSATAMWDWMKFEYGESNVWQLKADLKAVTMNGVELEVFFGRFNLALAKFKAAGGNMDLMDVCELILENINQTFYLEAIRHHRLLLRATDEVTESEIRTLKIALKEFHDATPIHVRESHQTRHKANFVDRSASTGNHCCDHCKKQNRWRIMKTHSTGQCRIGDVKGWGNYSNDGSNKGTSNYVAFHDSGSSPSSYFRSEPQDMVTIGGHVRTASSEPVKITGKGSVRFGDLTLNDVIHVPSFSKNLVSGIQIMKEGYKQEIENDKLIISKDHVVVATGHYNPEAGLIQMDNKICLSVLKENDLIDTPVDDQDPNTHAFVEKPDQEIVSRDAPNATMIHQRMGHIGSQMLRKTILAVDGLEAVSERNLPKCDACELGKSRRSPTQKRSSLKRDLLEVIESDTQGPFPVIGFDGTRNNVKFIDSRSGYVKMETIGDRQASTILECFKRFQARMERRTGKKILNIRTDMGTEYMGEFLDYIEQEGIVKQKGMPYQHSHPGKAERSHQTIMRMARAMLIESKLPDQFYSEAQLCASYLYNRHVHGTDTITPYEHVYGRKPNVSHLQPFGCIGYVHIPAENRSKLDPSGEKSRLIGFGDDDDTEEVKGYKMLRESDMAIIYSVDVVFEKLHKFLPLPDAKLYDDQEGDDLFGDPNYTPDEIAETDEIPSILIESEADESTNEDAWFSADDAWSSGHESNLIEELLIDGIDPKIIHECLSVSDYIPSTYEEAMTSEHSEKWREAMDKEMNSIRQHRTWQVSSIPRNRRSVKCRWVYTLKYNKKGEIIKFKARLVAKGYTQKKGLDFVETFAPVIKFKSIRILAALAATLKCRVYQDDVPTAFLKGVLKEEIYMDQVPGYPEGTEDQKLHLLKTLYGLKQSPREWNAVLDTFLTDDGFVSTNSDPCIYIKRSKTGLIVVGLYVDDIISFGTEEVVFDLFRSNMRSHFGILEGGPLEWYLGMCFDQQDDLVTMEQSQFIRNKLEMFRGHIGTGGASTPLPMDYHKKLQEAELSDEYATDFPYRSMVGSLMYAMTGTRPDLAAAVSIVSRHLERPKKIHCELVRHIYWYLKSNPDYQLTYRPCGKEPLLKGYVDAAYANQEGYKSTSGFAFTLNDSLISWYSGRQSVVAQSTAESEYYAAVKGANECVWLKQLLFDLGFAQGCVSLMEDNQACIILSKNPEDHKRTKHIQVKYHVLREYVSSKQLELIYCSTKSQLADLFTKILHGPILRAGLEKLGLVKFQQSGGELNCMTDELKG